MTHSLTPSGSAASHLLPPFGERRTPLIAIGASAGGPSAIATILGALSPGFEGAVIIVQHLEHRFAEGVARWLSTQSPLPVRIAREGDPATPGEVLFAAAPERHLVVTPTSRLHYSLGPARAMYVPSVDVFFESVAQHWRHGAVGVLLTGMGRDGAVGLRAMREAGAMTIAQDRESSVVYGMPKAAADIDAAVEVLPLDTIGQRLIQLVRHPLPSMRGTHGQR